MARFVVHFIIAAATLRFKAIIDSSFFLKNGNFANFQVICSLVGVGKLKRFNESRTEFFSDKNNPK